MSGLHCNKKNVLAALARKKKGKARKGDRKLTDKQVLYGRDDTMRCPGCRLLYANLGSYLDHALFCAPLDDHKKEQIRLGHFSRTQLLPKQETQPC